MIRLLISAVLLLATTTPAQPQPLRLGVTTHFSQGWPLSLLDRAQDVGVTTIRDSIHWPVIEQALGKYDFAAGRTQHVAAACAKGMTVLLVLEPRNPLYDGGTTAFSPKGREAFANYVHAVADRFRGCLTAIEIGNEINGLNGITGPAARNRIASHVALLRSVFARIKPDHPDIKILGGSTNAIGTGFLTQLFEAGALNYVDGVVVHPYRNTPEGVEWELGRLRAAMERFGRAKPIWATEFSREFVTPEDASAFYLKMFSLMTSAGVGHTYWYALTDQGGFPTMGLLTQSGVEKPAARAFSYAASQLAPRGLGQRIGDDPSLYYFRFGQERAVIWGARRTLTITGNAIFRRADGTSVSRPKEVTDEPVIIEGPATIGLGPPNVVADSFYSFGQQPLTYYARRSNGALQLLSPIDWKWTTYVGTKANAAMIINQASIAPSGKGAAGFAAIVRMTTAADETLVASLCLSPKSNLGDPIGAMIAHNGNVVWQQRIGASSGTQRGQVTLNVKRGDIVDFTLSPGASFSTRFTYRYRLSKSALDAASC